METKKHDPEKRKIYLTVCETCGKVIEGRNSRRRFCNRKCNRKVQRTIYTHFCMWCFDIFESENKQAKYCSLKCVGEKNRIEAIEKAKQQIPRHIFPSKRARREYLRRKRIRDGFVEHVDINVLIKRDNGLCQLCKEPVRLDVDYLHDLAPTKDHIIAVSNGGEHSYANSQLAHRICNNVKNNHNHIKGEAYEQTKQKRKGATSEVANQSRNKYSY